MKKLSIIATAVSLVLAASLCIAADKIALPKGYEKWEKSKEKVVNDKKSLFYGIHYTYVDKKAWPAFKAGGNIPRGAGSWWSSIISRTKAASRSGGRRT